MSKSAAHNGWNLLQHAGKFYYKLARVLHIYNLRYSEYTENTVQHATLRCQKLNIFQYIFIRFVEFGSIFAALSPLLMYLCFTPKVLRLIFEEMPTMSGVMAQIVVFAFLIMPTRALRLLRIVYKLIQRGQSRRLLPLLIELLSLQHAVWQLTHRKLHVQPCIVWLYQCKHVYLLAHLWHFREFSFLMPLCVLDLSLFELVFYAYQTLQLTILSLQRNLNIYIEARLVQNVVRLEICNGHCTRRVKPFERFLNLQQRLSMLHVSLARFSGWFMPLLYADIFSIVYSIAFSINCLLKHENKTSMNSLIFFLTTIMGYVLYPWLNLFFITLSNDETQAQLQRTQDLLMITLTRMQQIQKLCDHCQMLQGSIDQHLLEIQLFHRERFSYHKMRMQRRLLTTFISATLLNGLSYGEYFYASKDLKCGGEL